MQSFVHFPRKVSVLVIALTVMVLPVYGQINTPCTASMISSFTPCLGFLSNSTSNASSSPTTGCCSSLKALTNNGKDCLCLILTGSVPFNIPINRTLAISLPRACNMPGVPLQCKAIGAPVPAPGPAALGPTPSSPTPKGSVVPEPTPSSEAPESDTTPALTPSSSADGVPTATTGIRPVLTPSTGTTSYHVSPTVVLIGLSLVVLKYY